MAHCGINGKGDNKSKSRVTDVTYNYYARVHRWVNRQKGKADKCENPNCEHQSYTFQWALIHGKQHEKNVDNYISLCRKCHAKYDYKEEIQGEWLHKREWTEESRLKISTVHKGKKISEEHKQKLSKLYSGSGNPMYGKNKKGVDHNFYGKKHKEESKIKLLNQRAKVSKEQIIQIKKLVEDGIQQKEIASIFGISRASVCRIVNNKRYKLWF